MKTFAAVMLIAGVLADGHRDKGWEEAMPGRNGEMDEMTQKMWREFKDCQREGRKDCVEPPMPENRVCGNGEDGVGCWHPDYDHHDDHDDPYDMEDGWDDMWDSSVTVTASAGTLIAAVLALNA